MIYKLPSDIEQRLKDRLSEGDYQSEDEVLRDALDALDARRDEKKLRRWHERNQIADEQCQQGLCSPLDIEAILERVEKRVAETRNLSE